MAIFSRLKSIGGQAALVRAVLENLSAWAVREWPVHWNDRFGQSELQDALDLFLPEGLEHAQTIPALKKSHSAVIARALLVGIARSGTHSGLHLETALGVPLPQEA